MNKKPGRISEVGRVIEIYPSIMFYLKALTELDRQFPDLYGKSENDEEDIRFEEDPFSDSFGWVFNCIKVAEVKGLSIHEGAEMTALEALSILT